MPFPTIPTVAAGRVLFTNQADASGTRTFPDLSSLTKNSGDLLVAIVVGYQAAGSSGAVFSSWGGSFTEFSDQMTTSGSTLCVGMAYKISTGSETGTFTVTQASPTGHASLCLLSIPGWHGTTAPEASTIANGTTSAADPSSFNPSNWDAEDTLWISVVVSGMTSGTGSWTATGTTAPTNYTDRADSNTTDNSTVGQTEIAVAFRQLNASSEDVGTAGVDTSNARNSALVIAVRGAPSVAYSASVTDGVDLGDTATYDAGGLTASATDGLKVGDTAAAQWSTSASATDGLKVGDTIAGIGAYSASATEGAKFGDNSAYAASGLTASVTDGVKLGESLGSAWLVAGTPDAAQFGDTVSVFRAARVANTDGAKFADSATYPAPPSTTYTGWANAGWW